MLIIESKQFLLPVEYRNSAVRPSVYFIGFWNAIGNTFIPSMEVLEFINLYKNTDLSELSASINPNPKKGVYSVFIFKRDVDRSLPKFVLVKQGKLSNTLESYWNMTRKTQK